MIVDTKQAFTPSSAGEAFIIKKELGSIDLSSLPYSDVTYIRSLLHRSVKYLKSHKHEKQINSLSSGKRS